MVDLTARVAGLTLRNPVIVGSCELTMSEAGIRACVDAGAGAVVAKSINERPEAAEQLDIADYVLLDVGHRPVQWRAATGTETLLNRSGLAQVRVDDWVATLERAQRHAAAVGSMVIGSVTVASPEGAAQLAARMAEVVPAIEINVGAPHGREAAAVRQLGDGPELAGYVRAVRRTVSCPVIVKLPGSGGDVVAMAAAAIANGADAVAMIGRLNGFMPSIDTHQPELGSWGAVGGGWMLPVALYWVSKTCRALDEADIIGTNGARSGLDIVRFLLSGACAVELASLVLMRGPDVIADLLAELTGYLERRGIDASARLIGEAARRALSYSELAPIVPPRRPWDSIGSA